SGVDVRVAMVTAVDPDFDVIEMGFDDYIVKPVKRDELLELLDQLKNVSSYGDLMQEYYQLAQKKATLEASKSNAELRTSDEYARLVERLKTVQRQVDSVPHDQPENAFRELA
ncbi:MAG: HalX domain-containing protein, partial [Halobacteriales archaeon]